MAAHTPEHAARAAVVAEAMSWLGTPYRYHARSKGSGVDCAQILIAIYAGLGLAEAVEPGAYAQDWHLHRSEEMYIQWVLRAGGREVQTPALGDIALFQFGRTYSHGAVAVGEGEYVHSLRPIGVIRSRTSEAPLHARPVRFFSVFPAESPTP